MEQKVNKLGKNILKNATLLKQCETLISDRARLATSQKKNKKVKALHRSGEKIEKALRCKHYDEMPYHPLPNASVYEVVNSPLNWISLLFGILEREKGDVRTILNWKNGEANRFVRYMFNYLGHLRDEGHSRKYWKKGVTLLENKGFQMMAINHVISGFHMTKTEKEMDRILKSLSEIIKERKTSIPMRRVYIEKSNGKWRPLGVPEVSWRVYLHMWNCLIVWWRQGKDRNHAYFPGKGIHTAWDELLPKLISSENIYEFDLKSFFPSVDITGIKEIMKEKLEIPEEIAHYLTEMHRSITKIPKEMKLEESSDIEVLLTPSGEINPNIKSPLKEKVIKALELKGAEREQTLEKLLPKGWTMYRTKGVPQGTATSCGIATISLYFVWQLLGDKLIMYADDGILFPENEEDIKHLSDEKRGIEPNEEKSGWVKRSGIWLKDGIKFLGLRYNHSKEGSLNSSTRNGGELEYNLAAQLLCYLKSEWDEVLKSTMGLVKETKTIKTAYSPYLMLRGIKETERRATPRSRLNPYQDTKGWLEEKLLEFEKLEPATRLKQLFSKSGLKTLAEMYNGEWGIPNYEPERRYVKGSWLHIHGGRFQYEEIKENWRDQLTIQYWKRICRLTTEANLPEIAHEIWEKEWWLELDDKTKKEAERLKSEMEKSMDLLMSLEGTEEFNQTVNSLFKWNIPKEKTKVNWELRRVLRKLLQNSPFDAATLSSMAISDYLQGRSSDRSIRKCIAQKTKGNLVSRLPRDSSPKKLGQLSSQKDFLRKYHIEFQKLIPVLKE